ncbi:MAG: GAF domain-containing protein [Clostridiales bacterium]|nr:GAF domain-containing protein [Clostridiales bacterium]
MADYEQMLLQAEGLLDGKDWSITTLSNASALLYDTLEDLNWAGFYLMRNGELQLGPFQGKVACTHIAVGKGVCGTAVAEDQVQCVYDVHQFPGHIACDSASNSEIVIPLHVGGEVIGVLDIDSPLIGRFTEEDEKYLRQFAAILERSLSE